MGPRCHLTWKRIFFSSFSDTEGLHFIPSISYPCNGGNPCFPTQATIAFSETSHKSIQQSRARWNLTITSSLERLKRLFTTLTLRFFIFIFFWQTKRSLIRKRTRDRGTTFISCKSSLNMSGNYCLTPVSDNDETYSPKPTPVVVSVWKLRSPFIYPLHTGSHQPPALLSV